MVPYVYALAANSAIVFFLSCISAFFCHKHVIKLCRVKLSLKALSKGMVFGKTTFCPPKDLALNCYGESRLEFECTLFQFIP